MAYLSEEALEKWGLDISASTSKSVTKQVSITRSKSKLMSTHRIDDLCVVSGIATFGRYDYVAPMFG